MSSLVGSLLSFVLLYKYAALFAVTLLAQLGIPIPSGAIAVAAFVFAGEGYMNPWLVALAAAAGNVTGDLIGFGLARRYGREVVLRLGWGRVLHTPLVAGLERRVASRPVLAVFLTRLTTTLTPAANLLAGFAALSWRAFIVAGVLGELAETALNFVYGRFFGESWVYASSITGKIGIIVISLAALAVLYFWRRRRSHHRALAAHGLDK
jgi:membrane protein DedA with SNARE-associated domain